MDRRTTIADAAISLISDSGLRALTHRGIDASLDLPAGSTSYYFRTKEKLLGAVIERITSSSREAFEFAIDAFPGSSPDPTDVTVRYLEHLLDARADQLRARHALLVDPAIGSEHRANLAVCLFSIERAEAVFGARADDLLVGDSRAGEARVLAEGFVALCEGLVIAGLMQSGSGPVLSRPVQSKSQQGRIELRIPLVTYLQGAGKA